MKGDWQDNLAWRRGQKEREKGNLIEELKGMPAGTHRGNGIDGVQDGKEKHTVDAPGVIRVPRTGDLLAGRVIDKSWVASNIDLVVGGVVHSVASSQHIFKLHQCLSLFRHYHHIAGRENAGFNSLRRMEARISCELTPPWSLDYSVHCHGFLT